MQDIFLALILKSVFLYVTWHCATIKLSLQGICDAEGMNEKKTSDVL